MPENSPLESKLNAFISTTAKTKVAVVIPLFGYWMDKVHPQLTAEVLRVVLDRVYSNIHNLIILFVAEPQRIPKDVGNIMMGRSVAGNTQGVKMPVGSNYGEYVREGITTALEDTDAQFIIVINPWIIIQHGAIDALVERLNRGDQARIVSGFDLRNAIEADKFDQYNAIVPKEERDITFNLMGMARYTAEMIELDENLKTHAYMERDTWQAMFKKGYEVITTQRVPIFSFVLEWNELESNEDVEADKTYFVQKWGFNPGIK